MTQCAFLVGVALTDAGKKCFGSNFPANVMKGLCMSLWTFDLLLKKHIEMFVKIEDC